MIGLALSPGKLIEADDTEGWRADVNSLWRLLLIVLLVALVVALLIAILASR